MVTVTMPIEDYNMLLKSQEDANKKARIELLLLEAVDRMTVGGLVTANEFLAIHGYTLARDNGRMKLQQLKK
jgi:hypothetical protein